MDEVRIPRAGDAFYAANKRRGSTRNHRVDFRFWRPSKRTSASPTTP